jgi:hypothetical protein
VADDFKWLRALIREWSPGWNFTRRGRGPRVGIGPDHDAAGIG